MARGLTWELVTVAVVVGVGPVAWSAARDAGTDTPTTGQIVLVAGRTTTVVVQVDPLQPLERQPLFLDRVPSFHRALSLDADQRWFEAAVTYQQALIEIGHAAGLDDSPSWEQAAFRIDVERRRSQSLARGRTAGRTARARGTEQKNQRPLDLERGRLLRLKLMLVRAATGTVPPGLASATIAALAASLEGPVDGAVDSRAARTDQPTAAAAVSDAGDPEVRLLLCATRAAIGDRAGARRELAHVALSTRLSAPVHALSLAICQAALGNNEDALGSLAVGVYRLGPSSRFLPGQTRELQSANDWDPLRRDPRFERIFR